MLYPLLFIVGFKIELTPEEEADGLMMEANNRQQAENAMKASPIPSDGAPTEQQNGASADGATSVEVGAASSIDPHASAGGDENGCAPHATSFAQLPKPVQQLQQQHAIQYVTTIRNRFQKEPDTYRAFLRILHTYQKEQKGIKDVLEQVSQLFADHPDLLMEFTYFLPDAVQEQAKERLQRAASEAEARKRRNMQAGKSLPPLGGGMYSQGPGAPAGKNKRARDARGNMPPGAMMQGQYSQQQMMMDGQKPNQSSMMFHQFQQQQQFMQRQQQIQRPGQPNIKGQPLQMSVQQPGGKNKSRRRGAENEGMMSVGPNGQMYSPNQQNINMAMGANGMVMGTVNNQMGGQMQMVPPPPQVHHHYSTTTERKFFDQIKDYLYNISKESWQEFVRLLELYSQEVISKKDMFALMQDLFGSAGIDLFDEFKCLMNARISYQTNESNMWYGTPSSEIDFTQSRKCTPSYRALPKTYPVPVCSERGELEQSVLNDEWVSIPIGSEDSYSFKAMRKNQFEEALFKLEDERFEIDMVIDSNMCTIRMLEPIAEELKSIKALEEKHAQSGLNAAATCFGVTAVGAKQGASATAAGLTTASSTKLYNTKFNLQLERRNISTIHLNAIARIYGEHGAEILELLRKNPATTIPTVLNRLKQKDTEWRKARLDINGQWKELMCKNFEKSLDHCSVSFKMHDKRFYSARNLVADLKGLEVNNNQPMSAQNREELSKQAGIFFSVGDAERAQHKQADTPKASDADADATVTVPIIPTPLAALTADMNTSLALSFNNASAEIHKDIHKIICHAAECTSNLSPFDKERISALYRDLIRVFFNIPVAYMYGTPEEDAQRRDKSTVDELPVADPWICGTRVITLHGPGIIESYVTETNSYNVKLASGSINLKPSCVIGAEELSMSALSAVGVTRNVITPATSSTPAVFEDTVINVPTLKDLIELDKQLLASWDASAAAVANATAAAEGGEAMDTTVPEVDTDNTEINRVQRNASATEVPEPCRLFYGTQMCYVFSRLYHTLFTRLEHAKQLSVEHQESYRVAHKKEDYEGHPLPPSYVNSTEDMEKEQVQVKEEDGGKMEVDGVPAGAAVDAETALVTTETGTEDKDSSSFPKPRPGYAALLSTIQGYVGGTVDGSTFDDTSRQLLGSHGYIICTIDKIIQQMVKCLQAMAADETVTKLVGLFVYHRSRGGNDSLHHAVIPKLYQAHVAQLLLNSNEEVYRLQLTASTTDVERGENASILACSFLGHLYTPNHSTMTDVSKQQELVLDDVEDEEIPEEAAAESKPITLGTGAGSPGAVSVSAAASGLGLDGADGNGLTQDTENDDSEEDEEDDDSERGDDDGSGVDQGDGTMDEDGEDDSEDDEDENEGEGESSTRVAGVLLDGEGVNEDDLLQDILEAQASLIVNNNASVSTADAGAASEPVPVVAPEPEYTSNRSKRSRR